VLRVGLTGGIACGKSHVVRRLAERGIATLDLDLVAHEVMEPGRPGYDEVVEAFGPGVVGRDGRIDRKALGALVFRDDAARDRLNAIVHPKVRAEEARRAAEHAQRGGLVFVTDAALLVETGVHLRFDRLVVVHCPEDEQLRRLVARDGLSEEAARARLLAQMPIEAKRRFGHWQVDTSGRIADTHAKADTLAGELVALATALPSPVDVPVARARGLVAHGPLHGPRGLDPETLLAEIVDAGGLEMERLARRLVPPGSGPWYRRGSAGVEPGPESLAGPVVLWALARRGPDPGLLVAAAASLARLTHGDPASLAAATTFALALSEVAMDGRVPSDVEGRLQGWMAQAERWASGSTPPRVTDSIRVAAAHSRSPRAARDAARSAGLDPGLAGALVGLAVGASPEEVGDVAQRALAGLPLLRR
jgi:dephospho-CoA kinase